MIGKSNKKFLKKQAREVNYCICLLFCVFDYKLINTVSVFTLRVVLVFLRVNPASNRLIYDFEIFHQGIRDFPNERFTVFRESEYKQ